MKEVVIYQVLANAVWLACVLGGAAGRGWIGTTAALAFAGWHVRRKRRANELWTVLAAAITGAAMDVFLVRTEAVAYPSGVWVPGFGPHWIVGLWIAFGANLNVSFGWLRGRPFLTALVGAICGPLSYVAGWRLGAVRFPLSITWGLTALAVAWIVALPVLVALAGRFERTADRLPADRAEPASVCPN